MNRSRRSRARSTSLVRSERRSRSWRIPRCTIVMWNHHVPLLFHRWWFRLATPIGVPTVLNRPPKPRSFRNLTTMPSTSASGCWADRVRQLGCSESCSEPHPPPGKAPWPVLPGCWAGTPATPDAGLKVASRLDCGKDKMCHSREKRCSCVSSARGLSGRDPPRSRRQVSVLRQEPAVRHPPKRGTSTAALLHREPRSSP